MEKMISNFQNQFIFNFKISHLPKIKKIKNIIICGMGGSAICGNLVSLFLKEKGVEIPVILHRNYRIPNLATKQSLILIISFSGNTEETISSLKNAFLKKLNIIAISTNGQVEKFSKKNKIAFIKINRDNLCPRLAQGYLFSAVLFSLWKLRIIKNPKKEIEKLRKKLLKLNKKYQKKGKDLSKKILGKIPLIYASFKYKNLARFWKTNFNENSKIPAFWNYFPELNHNEMVGFDQKTTNKLFYIMIIRDKLGDDKKILKRMNLFQNLANNKKIKVSFLDIEGKNILEKIFSNLILSYWVSFYLAKLKRVDPLKVKTIEEFKKRMKGK